MNKYLPLIVLYLLVFSCTKENNEESLAQFQNSSQPSDNELILSESTFGNATSFSEFNLAEKSTSDDVYVIGRLNSSQASNTINVGDEEGFEDFYDPILIKFDSNGNKLWEVRPGIVVERFKIIPSGMITNDEYIVLAGYDTNSSNQTPRRSRIMIYDHEGNFINNYSGDFVITFDDIAIKENNNNHIKLLIVGIF